MFDAVEVVSNPAVLVTPVFEMIYPFVPEAVTPMKEPAKMRVEEPPEPHAPTLHVRKGEDEDTCRQFPTFPAVVVEMPVPP